MINRHPLLSHRKFFRLRRRTGSCSALLALLYVAQCAWFIRTQSLTYDEPVHIAEGLNAWRYGRFEQYNDHPPLARLWCYAPAARSEMASGYRAVARLLSRHPHRTRPGIAGMARARHECPARLGAGLVSMEGRRSAVFPDRREFRAGPVRVLAFPDRSFFDRGHRRRRDAVYFCHGMDTGALAP